MGKIISVLKQKIFIVKSSKYGSVLIEYFVVVLVTCLLMGIFFKGFHISIPLGLSGDPIFQLAGIKALWSGTFWSTNPYIGAPLGSNWLDYPQSDNLHLLIIYLLMFIFRSPITATNIFYILTFFLSSIFAYYAFRNFKIAWFLSLPGALAFSFLPFHIFRSGHLYLAAYYLIPLIILLIYYAAEGKINFFSTLSFRNINLSTILKNRGFWISLGGCLLFGSAGIYYAFFAATIASLLAIKLFLTKYYQKSFTLVVIAAMIGFSVILNLSPSIYYKFTQRSPSIPIAVRVPSESEIYGLKIIQMLLPSSIHHVAQFREIAQRYQVNFPLVNENITASLGIIGSIGFLFSLAFLFTKQREDPLVGFLGFSTLSCLLLGTIGGFGALVAFFITPQIRGYNRISVFIAFFAIAQFCWIAQGLYLRFQPTLQKTKLHYVAFVLLIGLVYYDQIWTLPRSQAAIIPVYTSDRQFITQIERLLPENAMVYQLPYMDFPEVPPVNNLQDYSHFKAYLYSTNLRWSYGAIKGRESAQWNSATAKLPVEKMIVALSVAGFSGIYIDRDGYTTQESLDLEKSIRNILQKEPIISPDNKLVFYDIRPYAQALETQSTPETWAKLEDIYTSIVNFRGDFSALETNGTVSWRWSGPKGTLTLLNFKGSATTLSFDVVSATGQDANLVIKSKSWNESFKIGAKPTHIEHQISVGKDPVDIQFLCDGPVLIPGNGDLRQLVFRIDNFK